MKLPGGKLRKQTGAETKPKGGTGAKGTGAKQTGAKGTGAKLTGAKGTGAKRMGGTGANWRARTVYAVEIGPVLPDEM